ncbi:sugar ABC transporter ATP-binding protein [Ornithinimicrobium faecis]|uniref:sugar ABC transporter ATP-binding protein n=1 Tax=Ornithinimicrobium faecis TaxID=2934158 RepID=UPI00211844A5|nr:sugar ABC transporter ATP-binding protein [Ornithinimicrobium sp. HY1745]
MADDLLFQAHAISKHFGVTKALTDVSLTLAAGERVAVMGENGAGKSTLMKVMAGVHTPDAGTMALEGRPYSPGSPLEAIRAGIATVYQEPSVFQHLSVLDNLFMGRQPTGLGGRVDRSRMRTEAVPTLERVGLSRRHLHRRMGELSLAEQQLVLVAKIVAHEAKILILDEPTSILTATETSRLLEIVNSLAEAGTGILYITHRFEELGRIADRFVVLRDGHNAGEVVEPDRDAIVAKMSGRQLEVVDHGHKPLPPEAGEVALRAEGLASASGAFADIDLTLSKGRIVGLYGLIGSGRTEIALSLLGEHPLAAGSVEVSGTAYRPATVRQGLRKGIAYLPEDRKTQGLFQHMSISANTSQSVLPRLARAGFVDTARERSVVSQWVDRLRIKLGRTTDRITSLSGGNQQKVLLARQLATSPSVLLLDEPTRGIDVGTKNEIHKQIRDFARDGMAVLLISSELPEVLALSDEIHVIYEGGIAGSLPATDANEERILTLATGGDNA